MGFIDSDGANNLDNIGLHAKVHCLPMRIPCCFPMCLFKNISFGIFIVSVLGQEEGYTVKYTPLPEGVTKGQSPREFLKAKEYT